MNIHELKSFLAKNKNATTINLSKQEIDDADLKLIAAFMKDNNTVTILNLADNNIENINDLVQAFTTNTALQQLNLNNNQIYDVRQLGEMLHNNTTLTHLWLNNNKIDDVNVLAQGLVNNKTLTQLGLHKNHIHDTIELGNMFLSNVKLRYLWLNNNKIKNVDPLAKGLADNETLELLYLGNNQIQDVSNFGHMLGTNQTLRYIWLNNNNIENANVLAQGLANNPNTALIYLNLSNNQITDISEFSKMLWNNKTVQQLYFDNNNITNINTIAKGLIKNTTLKSLEISNNKIQDIDKLARIFAINNTLKQLNLADNKIENVNDLFRWLVNNKALTAIALENNQIKDVSEAAKALVLNDTLKQVYFADNKIENQDMVKFVNELIFENLGNPNQAKNRVSNQEEQQKLLTLIKDIEKDFKKQQLNKQQLNKQQDKLEQTDYAPLETLEVAKEVLEEEVNQQQESQSLTAELIESEQEQQQPLITTENKQKQQQQLKEQSENFKEVSDIAKLLSEGNDIINTPTQNVILLLGNTGSGKSTVAHALSGLKLQWLYNEESGKNTIDAKEQIGSIRIGHNMKPKTTVPNKSDLKEVVIWDFPGFNNNDPTQEIANLFYMQQLISQTKNLKIALVVMESIITADQGSHFIALIQKLIKSFKNISELKNSLSLIITHATETKKSDLKQIENILNHNTSLSAQTKDVIHCLSKSVQLFHKPLSEGILLKSSMLEDITKSTTFVESSKISANMVMSEQAKEQAQKLLNISEYNIKSLLEIVESASQNAPVDFDNSKGSIYLKKYPYFHQFLPKNIKTLNGQYTHKYSSKDHFLHLDQQKALLQLLDKVDLSKAELPDLVKIAHGMLDIFSLFVTGQQETKVSAIDLVKNIIKNYSYVLDQQLRYIEFFQAATGQKVDCQKYLSTTLSNCQKVISANLEQQSKDIELKESSDIKYFEKAIEHLEIYKNDQKCAEKIAKANDVIGDIYSAKKDLNKALSFYIKALKINKKLPETYEKIGDILADKGKYQIALDFYKVADQSKKVKDCYNKLLETADKDKIQKLKFFEEKGEYFASKGDLNGAIKCYNNAQDLTYDTVIKTSLINKIKLLITNQDSIVKNMEEIANSGEFYNFNLVTPEELDQCAVSILGDD